MHWRAGLFNPMQAGEGYHAVTDVPSDRKLWTKGIPDCRNRKGRKRYESIGFSESVEIQPWIVYNGYRKMTEESWDTGDEP